MRDHVGESFGQRPAVHGFPASHYSQATARNAFCGALLLEDIEDPESYASGDAELAH
ncbi:hypothetical protein ACOMD4_07545 [Streptomyces anulatus]|uniref:hypothetical protein n=1 Tax=Streptomyces anulatus TaxID=1892 RepID=UPI003B7D1761